MKKLLTILLSLGLIVALSACIELPGDRPERQGDQPQSTTTTSSTGTTTTTATDASQTTTTTSGTVLISRDRAIELALQAAELTRDAVYDLEAELDRERGNLYWEVDFETREYEYSYDVHAETGEIAKVERDRND